MDKYIETVKQMIADGQVTHDVAEKYFPELAESEDEKIRKEIINWFNEFPDLIWRGLRVKDIFAWLEKQKSVDKVESVLDIEIPFGAKGSELYDATYHIPEGFYAEIVGDKVVIKKGEQKPTFDDTQIYLKGVKRVQGHKELSEYEKIFDKIAASYAHSKNKEGYNQPWYTKERAAEMLYHAKKAIEQKPEWSEEDEKIKDTTISFLEEFKDKGYENAVMCIDWLKSLRPQKQWKPSEKQIEALSYVVVNSQYYVFNERTDALITLFNDLKQL